jgi:hypothetical protein
MPFHITPLINAQRSIFMIKKVLVFTLLAFCLMAASSAFAQTVHLKDIGMSIDVPEGCAAFYDGHVDEAQAQKYMGMDKKKMTAYLKECGYQMVICQKNPSCEVMIASKPGEEATDWNDMDFSSFLGKMAAAAEAAKKQLNITKMMPLITNQARYSFAHFTVDASTKRTFDMYQYQTQVARKSVAITCLAYDDTIDEEKAFFDQVMDSIWYDGVDSIYGPAPTASGKGKGKAVTTDALSLQFPKTWSAKPSNNMEFYNGYINLNITTSDGWATLSAEQKKGRDRSGITFDGIVDQNGFDSIKDWVKQMASDLETGLSAIPMTMVNLMSEDTVKAFGIPDSMLKLLLDCSVSFDDGAVIMLDDKPFILLTGKSIMTGEDELVMVRFTQDIRLYYNIYNGYTNMLRFTGAIREDAAREMEKVLGTVKFE